MTDEAIHKKLKEYYENNLERYIKEHPGEYILIEENFVESFYKNKVKFGDEIYKKYWNFSDYTVFGTMIPQNNSESIALKNNEFA